RLQALLPAPSAEDPGAEGAGPILPVSAGTAPATVPGEVAPDGVAPDEVAPGGDGPGGDVVAPGGTTASGIVWGGADPVGPLGLAPAAAVPSALRVAPDSCALAGSARVAGLGRAGSVPPGPASSGAAAHPETATQPHGEGAQPHGEGAQPHSEGGQSLGEGSQPRGGAAQPSQTVMEQCPHCHQPVTVIIVAGAPPAAGGPVGQ
ncbi:MAG: hypothetical protein ABSF03_18050, partial [Streptosporangiaceae bacterium]